MVDRTRILTSAASIASTGAFTLIPIGRASAPVRWGLGAALSLVPAAVAAIAVERRMRDRATRDRVAASAGAGVAVGVVSLAGWEASVRVDRAIERSLVRRRVRRPRVVMAVGAAALAGGIELLDVLVSRRAER